MTDLLLGPALGKLTAICADPRGWLVVWQEAGTLVLAQLHPNGQRRVPDTPIDCGGVPNSFPRVYRDARNASWLAYRENPSNLGRLLNLTTGQRYELGLVHGNYPIAFGDDCVVWHASETFQRKMAALTDPSRRLTMVGSFGAGTGLSHIAGGKVLGLDELRTSEPGMVNPQRAAGCVVGENADAGPDRNIARLEDGRECALWPGVASFMPQIAKRGSEISAEPETWAVATYGGPGPRLALLADADFALPKPPDPPPPVLPDIPWTTDLARTVEDLLVYVRESATAEKVIDAERGVLWCHKSPERPNWGERFGYDKDSIGLFEDTSTGTRMVSVARPAEPNRPGKNLTRTRLSPEEILERNARGENLGDPLTLPLAGYTFTPNSLFMPRRFTGRFERTFDTLLDWWDEPSRRPVSGVSPPRGRWELHRERFQIIAEAGYGRYNGYEVFARTHYGKPDGAVEWNYWGPQGRIRFENWIRQPDGSMVEEVAARSQRPAHQPTNARGPYVESRFPSEFPITPSASLPAKPLPGQTTEPTPPKEPAVKSREQFFAEFRAVNDFYAAPEGLQRPGGMVIGGQCDTEAMAAWGYNLMVGGTVEGIKAAIRTSEEWRIKHANDPVQPVPAFSGPIGVSAKDFVVP